MLMSFVLPKCKVYLNSSVRLFYLCLIQFQFYFWFFGISSDRYSIQIMEMDHPKLQTIAQKVDILQTRCTLSLTNPK